MLMLLFRIKDEPWALSIAEVKDLIPLVKLQSCEHLGENVVGILNYHGEHLPVVDVSSIVAHQRAPDAFSTRIAIIELEKIKLGLILDQAYETTDLTKTVDIPLQTFTDTSFIQALFTNAEGSVIQQLALAPFLSKVRSSPLRFPEEIVSHH